MRGFETLSSVADPQAQAYWTLADQGVPPLQW